MLLRVGGGSLCGVGAPILSNGGPASCVEVRPAGTASADVPPCLAPYCVFVLTAPTPDCAIVIPHRCHHMLDPSVA